MLDGDVNLGHFTPERVNDASLTEARTKVKVTVHYDWPSGTMESPVVVTLVLKDGQKVTRERQYAIGAPKEPLTKEQFRELYHKFTQGRLDTELIDQTADSILNVEGLEDMRTLMKTLTFGPFLR